MTNNTLVTSKVVPNRQNISGKHLPSVRPLEEAEKKENFQKRQEALKRRRQANEPGYSRNEGW